MAKSDLHREYVLELENELREFEKREQGSTKRMQLLVYPAMVAFIILAAYGFYMIQSLTDDIHTMSKTVTNMADSIGKISTSVDSNMDVISKSTVSMTDQLGSMVDSTQSMSGNVGSMTNNLAVMQNAVSNMAWSTNNMQQDMWSLNQNVSTPLSMFNKFLPWNNNSNGRYPGSRALPYQPQYIIQQPQAQQYTPQQVMNNAQSVGTSTNTDPQPAQTGVIPQTVNPNTNAVPTEPSSQAYQVQPVSAVYYPTYSNQVQ